MDKCHGKIVMEKLLMYMQLVPQLLRAGHYQLQAFEDVFLQTKCDTACILLGLSISRAMVSPLIIFFALTHTDGWVIHRNCRSAEPFANLIWKYSLFYLLWCSPTLSMILDNLLIVGVWGVALCAVLELHPYS